MAGFNTSYLLGFGWALKLNLLGFSSKIIPEADFQSFSSVI